MARGIATRALAGGHTVTLLGHEPGDAQQLASELSGNVPHRRKTDGRVRAVYGALRSSEV